MELSTVALIEQWEQTASLLTAGQDRWGSPLQLRLGNEEASVNGFLTKLRHRYWTQLFEHPALTSKLTVQMRDELRHRIGEFSGYDFNLHNIKTLQLSLVSGLNQSVEDEAVRVFDTLSQKHALNRFSKNVHYYNGWTTNDAWKVGRRVIIPTYLGYFHSYNSGPIAALADIELVLNYFDGMAHIPDPVGKVLGGHWRDMPIGRKLSFHYFDATVYAKGTIHITFRNPELVKRLNVFAGKKYNMLPPDYGQAAYTDLDAEHRRVVDDFEGEESYRQTQAEISAGRPLLALAS